MIYSLSSAAPPATGGLAPAISLTDNALKHLNKMRSERNEDLCLRIGVKQGGCSGMSYTMEFEKRENARPDDSFIEYNGFIIGMFILFYVLCFLKINCQKLLPTIFNFKFWIFIVHLYWIYVVCFFIILLHRTMNSEHEGISDADYNNIKFKARPWTL